jgi:hypothetical protein
MEENNMYGMESNDSLYEDEIKKLKKVINFCRQYIIKYYHRLEADPILELIDSLIKNK